MKNFVMLLIAIPVLLTSCSDKKENPVINEDTVTLSTQFFGTNVYYVYGYSFEEGKKVVVSFPTSEKNADIVPSRIIKPDGSVIGAHFSVMSNNPYGFKLEGSFPNRQEALDFYNSLTSVDETSWETLSDTLAPFQVYAFKTYKENYVKFMVNAVNIIDTGSPTDNYVEIQIKYYIQRDGTPNF